ncbi:MAG TPA: hypothetical protein VHO50_01320 [Bacteroidales bacterium]|nr:hypothetical protein [Bacteroidales bacterium]
MDIENIDRLRANLSVKSKNGIDFIFSAGIIWAMIAFIWTLDYSTYNKSVYTFIAGGLMMPLALLFSKLFKTTWTDKENPLQPLGLKINFSQLFYFPFLIFSLVKFPDYFVMVYAIITGAHFYLYSWFYKTNLYAVFAGVISAGAMILGFLLTPEKMYVIPLLMSLCLFLLAVLLFFDSRQKAKSTKSRIDEIIYQPEAEEDFHL